MRLSTRSVLILLALSYTAAASLAWTQAAESGLDAGNTGASITLEDSCYRVEVSRSHGAVTRIQDKKTGIDLIREPRLANNFRFTLPIPGKEPWQAIEANYITGKAQKLSSFESGDKKLTLHWGKPLMNDLGEAFDASATVEISLAEEGVLFQLDIDNQTPYPIGEVFFPCLGGIQGLGVTDSDLKSTTLVMPKGDAVLSKDIFRVFQNVSAFGNVGAEQFYSYPKDITLPQMEFSSASQNQSVVIAVTDPADRPKTLWFELLPGNSNTVREDGNWPRPDELRGLPVGVTAAFFEFANTPVRTRYTTSPVLITFRGERGT